MIPKGDFSSEVLYQATYEITKDKFVFLNKRSSWTCYRDEIIELIQLLEKAIKQPTGYNLPPIRVKGTHRMIHIDTYENSFAMREELVIKFIEELKMVNEVYGG